MVINKIQESYIHFVPNKSFSKLSNILPTKILYF